MPESPHSDISTEGIRVQAAAQYFPAESDPDAKRYFYVYRIVITNDRFFADFTLAQIISLALLVLFALLEWRRRAAQRGASPG